jgi:hypothetical protein
MSAPLGKPRWPGGPKICPAENSPAFESAKALDAFLMANSPSCKVLKKWQCEACGHYHAYTLAPDPTGASSGQGRSSRGRDMEGWKRFFEARTPAELIAADAMAEEVAS